VAFFADDDVVEHAEAKNLGGFRPLDPTSLVEVGETG